MSDLDDDERWLVARGRVLWQRRSSTGRDPVGRVLLVADARDGGVREHVETLPAIELGRERATRLVDGFLRSAIEHPGCRPVLVSWVSRASVVSYLEVVDADAQWATASADAPAAVATLVITESHATLMWIDYEAMSETPRVLH